MKTEKNKNTEWIFSIGFILLPILYISLDFTYIPKLQAYLYQLEIKEESLLTWNHNLFSYFLFFTRLLFAICFLFSTLGFYLGEKRFRSYYKTPLFFLILWAISFFTALPYWILFEKKNIIIHTMNESKILSYNDIKSHEEKKGSKLSTLQIYFSNDEIVVAGQSEIDRALKLINFHRNLKNRIK